MTFSHRLIRSTWLRTLLHFYGLGLLLLWLMTSCGSSQRFAFQSQRPDQQICVNDVETQYDGRFSLGVNGQNLTYSWFLDQATWATSHFVVRLHNEPGSYRGKDSAQQFYASNYPLVAKKSPQELDRYLTGNLQLSGMMGVTQATIDYQAKDIQIQQTLTPVRSNFKDLRWRWQKPDFYRVTYTLYNGSPKRQKIGFQARLDPQLRQADGCVLEPIKHRQFPGKFLNVLSGMPKELDRKPKTLSRSPKWSKNLNAIRIHENKALNRNATMGFIFTGNRRKSLQPNRIHIGDWESHREQLWQMGRGRETYDDSGAILEWTIELEPGASQDLTYYYGLYHPGWGKRLFSKLGKPTGTIQLELQEPVDYLDGNYLRVLQDSAWIGDSVEVDWNIFTRECCPDKLDQLISNVTGLHKYEGHTWITAGCQDERYFMSLRVEKSKVYAGWSDSLYARYPYPPVKDPKLTTGLFTLGADQQSLLFGYPYPSTTSHFVLRTKDVPNPILSQSRGESPPESQAEALFNAKSYFASNEAEVAKGVRLTPDQYLRPEYPRDQMSWLKGYPTKVAGQLIFPVTRGTDSLFLEQRVTPCNDQFVADPTIKQPKLYRVDYYIRNVSCHDTREFDFAFMLDPKLGQDEIGLIRIDSAVLPAEESFVLVGPEALQLIRTQADSAPNLDIVFGVNQTPRPEALFNTLWQAQRRRVSGVNEDLSILDDRALFAQWPTHTLQPGERITYSFVIGSQTAERTRLRYTKPMMTQSVLWFDFDRDTLIKGEVRVLRQAYDKFLRSNAYSHLVLEGFTGSLGSDTYNKDLAQRRLDHMIGWLTRWGIPRSRILTKLNGEYYAEDEPIRQRIRNSERVVLMKIY